MAWRLTTDGHALIVSVFVSTAFSNGMVIDRLLPLLLLELLRLLTLRLLLLRIQERLLLSLSLLELEAGPLWSRGW